MAENIIFEKNFFICIITPWSELWVPVRMKQLCLMLELKSSPHLIEEYERYHEPGNVWPEVIRVIRDSGISGMRIYRSGTRLAMLMEVEDSFDPAAKAANEASNPRVTEWERLMETFQDLAHATGPSGKWRATQCIFDLSEHSD